MPNNEQFGDAVLSKTYEQGFLVIAFNAYKWM